MPTVSARDRLCQVILGCELHTGQCNTAKISIPTRYDDISSDTLFAATEAVYSYSAEHVRQMLPFVLHSVEDGRTDLYNSGYFDSFFLHVNYEFCTPTDFSSLKIVDPNRATALRYTQEYRQNWVAPTLCAMNGFEHGWAYDWICGLLQSDAARFEEDLIMLARILGMALGKPESKVPSFKI